MKPNFPGEKPATKKENLLSLEAKRKLINFWNKVVISTANPVHIETLGEPELIEYLYTSLIQDIGRLCKEWNLIPDNKLVLEIAVEENPENKSKLEFKYLEELINLVRVVSKKFQELPENNNRILAWNSYPEAMRKNMDFDCTGAALLGMGLLSDAQIKSYRGNPPGHSVNIVKLSNGEWVWLDIVKGAKKINPKITEVEGGKIFSFDHPVDSYTHCYVTEKSGIVWSVIGNFGALKTEAAGENTGSGYPQDVTLKVYKPLEKDLSSIDFDELKDVLWPGNNVSDNLT